MGGRQAPRAPIHSEVRSWNKGKGGDAMEEKDLQQVEAMMSRVMGVFTDDVQHKLDLVVEGQQALVERMDRLEGRMDGIENRLDRVEVKVAVVEKKVDGLEKKVDGVAADLAAHRRDTEAHRGYRVRDE